MADAHDQIIRTRIGIEDRDGKGSTSAYVGWFFNALMQRRQIAFDGVKWFVQADTRSPFKPVSEEEVPAEVKNRFKTHIGNK